MEVVDIAVVEAGDALDLVEDDTWEDICNEPRLRLTTQGVLVTPDNVGVDGVPGTPPLCT
jgi:hypothetical protein